MSATATPVLQRRRVFISHSNADVALCKRLADVLRENSYEPFMDVDDIRAGADWEHVINQELSFCHAAVVVMSEAASRSTWVRREVNILLWRRALSRDFKVIPVLTESTSVAQLKATELDELLRVEVLRLGGCDEDLVVEKLLRELPPPAPASADPLTGWMGKLSRGFDKVPDGSRDILQRAANVMGVPWDKPVDWNGWDGAQVVAHQLLGPGLVDGRLEQALGLVADVLGRDDLSRLVQLAVPAWVDPEAARRVLPQGAEEDPDRMVVLMDVNGADIASDYLARAMCTEHTRYQKETVEQMPVGEETVDDLVWMWTASVRKMLGLTDRDPLNPRTPRMRHKVYYLVADCGDLPHRVIASAVNRMHATCPWLVIMLITARRQAFERALRGEGCTNVTAVRPPLAAEDEIRARQTRRAINDMPATVFGRG